MLVSEADSCPVLASVVEPCLDITHNAQGSELAKAHRLVDLTQKVRQVQLDCSPVSKSSKQVQQACWT